MAKIIGDPRPKNMPAAPISQTAERGSTQALPAMVSAVPKALASMKVLRTRVVEPPRPDLRHLRDREAAGLHRKLGSHVITK
jgi:hypothetical protein